jgi:hypothetical protein
LLLMAPTEVKIPGEFFARYEDGKITKLTFMPHASNAGYFGPAAVVLDGDADLDVEEVDGPFWRAMQAVLGSPCDRSGEAVTIEWEE